MTTNTSASTRKKTKAGSRTARKRPAAQRGSRTAARRVTLGAALRIANISELHQNLKTAANATEALTIDASAVDAVDTAALQLLVAFVRQLAGTKVKVEWLAPSATLCEAATVLDLRRHLEFRGGISECGA